MLVDPTLCRVLLAHVILDATLWARRKQEASRGLKLLKLPLLWGMALTYAIAICVAILPDRTRSWPAVLLGFVIILIVRAGGLFGQIAWTLPKQPTGLLRRLEQTSPLLYAWLPALLLSTLQLATVIVVCSQLTSVTPWKSPKVLALLPKLWIVLLVYALAFWPVGSLIALFGRQWAPELQADAAKGLAAGGLWIGRLERLLTVSFILAGHPEAIAGLVVAKGVIRFVEIKDADHRRVAEYILIGSMMSFGMAMLLGWIARHLLLKS